MAAAEQRIRAAFEAASQAVTAFDEANPGIRAKAAEAALLPLVTPEACAEKGELGQLTLHFAAMSSQLSAEIVSRILAANPDAARARNDFGMLPLHWAAARGAERAVEWLLRARAEPGATDTHGRAAPLWAAA